MQMGFAMSALYAVESLLWVALAVLFWTKGIHCRFRAMTAYITLRAATDPVMFVVLSLNHLAWGRAHHVATIYFYGYFSGYVASAVLLYFICMEVFRSALAPIPGILNFSVVLFRWVAVVSVIASVSSLINSSSLQHGIDLIAILYSIVRGVSVLELCLLVFLGLSMNTIRLPVRDMAFGIALGFALSSAGDFIMSAWGSSLASINDPIEFLGEGLTLATLGVWMVYCFLPQPVRQPILLPASSALFRWNEIATAFGHTGTKVAMLQPDDNGFFLSDVERVVDKVLTRNMDGEKVET
jgi:hypothetical protein